MGKQDSVTNNVSDIVSNAVTNVMMSSSQECGQTNTAVQELNFRNIRIPKGCSADFSNIDQTMVQTPNFKCAMESANQSDLVNKVSQELAQAAKAVTSGLSGAIVSSAQANNKAEVRSNIVNNINMSQTASCVQSNLSRQFQNYENISGQGCPDFCSNPAICALPLKKAGFSDEYIVKQCSKEVCKFNWNNITQNMTQKAVAECLSQNSNLSKAINDVSQKITQEAVAENKGIDIASSLASLGSFAIPLLICIICVCLICSSSIGSVLMGGFGGSGNSGGGTAAPGGEMPAPGGDMSALSGGDMSASSGGDMSGHLHNLMNNKNVGNVMNKFGNMFKGYMK